MDIRLVEADPTGRRARGRRCAARRAAIVVGRRAARQPARCAHVARRRPRHARAAASAAAGAAGAAGARRLDQRRRARLRLRSAERAAGRRLGRRHVLRAARDVAAAAARGPRLRRHRLQVPRRRRDDRGARSHVGPALRHAPHGRTSTVGDGAAVWMRSPCLGMCDQAPAALVTDAGERAARAAARHGDRRRSSPDTLQGGRARHRRRRVPRLRISRPSELRLLQPHRPRRSGRASTSYRRPAATRALEQALAIGPEAVIAEVTASKLMGRGGAAFPTGRKWEAVRTQPAHAALSRLQRRRVGARHVQGSRPDGGRSVRDRRSDDHRGVRDRLREGLPLHPRRVSAGVRAPAARDRSGATASACSARTSSGAACRSTSRFAAAPARTSAARRPRCSNRSRASAASRATSRRSPCRPGSSESRPWSTTSRRWSTSRTSCSRAAPRSRRSARRSRRARVCSVCAAPSSGRASTRRRSARRSAALIEHGGRPSPRTDAARGPARRRGGHVRPPRRTRHAADARGHARGRRDAGIRRRDGRRRHASTSRDLILRIAAFFRDESCGQCVPCRVGTVRQEEALHRIARRARAAALATEIALLDEVGVAMRDASICGLGQTAYAAVESAIKRLRLYEPSDRVMTRPCHARRCGRPNAPKPPRDAHDRRPDGSVPEGTTILGACATLGVEIPDAVLSRDAAPRERLPPLRRGSRGRAGAGAARARAVEAGMVVQTRSPRVVHCAQSSCSSCWRRRWICRPRPGVGRLAEYA